MRAKNAISKLSLVKTIKRMGKWRYFEDFTHTFELGVKVKKVLKVCKEILAKITRGTSRLKKITTSKSKTMMESKNQRMEKT